VGNGSSRRGRLRVTQPNDSTRRCQLDQRPPRHPQTLLSEPDHGEAGRTAWSQVVISELVAERPPDAQVIGRLLHREEMRLLRLVAMAPRRHGPSELHPCDSTDKPLILGVFGRADTSGYQRTLEDIRGHETDELR